MSAPHPGGLFPTDAALNIALDTLLQPPFLGAGLPTPGPAHHTDLTMTMVFQTKHGLWVPELTSKQNELLQRLPTKHRRCEEFTAGVADSTGRDVGKRTLNWAPKMCRIYPESEGAGQGWENPAFKPLLPLFIYLFVYMKGLEFLYLIHTASFFFDFLQ